MSGILNVGVFNVLSQGASNCSKIFTDQVFTDNVDAKNQIFALFDYISKMSPASRDKDGKLITGVPLYLKNKTTDLSCCNLEEIKKLFNNHSPNPKTDAENGISVLLNLVKINYYDEKKAEAIKAKAKAVAKAEAEAGAEAVKDKIIKNYKIQNELDEEISECDENINKLNEITELLEKKKYILCGFIDDIYKNNQTFGTFLKIFSQQFPGNEGNGFGLYGGFKLGGEDDKAMTAAGMKKVFNKKREFLKSIITEFFDVKNGNGHILVCPEFDYEKTFCVLTSQFKRVYKDIGEQDLYKIKDLTDDVPNIFLPKVNFCRSIFVAPDDVVTPIISVSDKIDAVKNSKDNIAKGPKKKGPKQNVDVNKITFKKDGNSIILISVHLDSTTSLDDIDVKNEELKNLLNLTLELKKKKTRFRNYYSW